MYRVLSLLCCCCRERCDALLFERLGRCRWSNTAVDLAVAIGVDNTYHLDYVYVWGWSRGKE